MLSIGEFARHAGVTVRMLRHYDALGLLVPAYVDPVTGYRHYSAGQLARTNRLVALKDLGFTLEQVGPVLDSSVGLDELRGMLTLRRAELHTQIEADRARLAAVERRLRTIESEGTMSELEYVEKSLPAVRLAQLTTQVATVEEIGPAIGPMFDRLAGTLSKSGVNLSVPSVAWYDGIPNDDLIRVAAAWPTVVDTVADPDVELFELEPAPRAMTTVYRGSMQGIGDAWQELERYVEGSGFQPEGRCREIYLETPADDPDGWVTELQQPVR